MPSIKTMSDREFVLFVASLMSVNALGIDLMLPALGQIAQELSIGQANHRQWIVTVFIAGFAVGSLFYGPLADRFGRRRTVIAALVGFIAASCLAALAPDFQSLLAARFLQGVMSAGARVIAIAVVRDRASGNAMARTMSTVQMVFLIVPILAPSLGQALLMIGPWRFIFYTLGLLSACITIWTLTRMAETMPRENRTAISFASLRQSYGAILRNLTTMGYAIAGSITFGGIVAYVSSAQQVLINGFGVGKLFPVYFAICAASIGAASFANSRMVERLGARLISEVSLVILIAISLVHIGVILTGYEVLSSYLVTQAITVACIGVCTANFGALAMEPLGRIAGAASSAQSFVIAFGSALVGSAIGQSYDGTTLPLAVGNLAIGVVALLLIFTVKRRLFQRLCGS